MKAIRLSTTRLSPKFALIRLGTFLPELGQSFKEKPGLGKIVLVGRVGQDLYPEGIGFALLLGTMFEVEERQLLEAGNDHAIIEGEAAVEIMAQRRMGKRMRQDHGQSGFIGQGIQNPRLIKIVWPMVRDFNGSGGNIRQRTSGSRTILLVTSRFVTTVCSTLSTSPSGTINPSSSSLMRTLSSARRCHDR